MNKTEVMRRLEAAGTAQNRKVYARHGVTGAMFGVSFAELNKLKREIKIDHPLAEQLWDTGNHDARVLATMIADPARFTSRTADGWVDEVHNHVDAAALGGLLGRSPIAESCAKKWTEASAEFRAATGWNLLAAAVLEADSPVTDAACEAFLRTIEARIHAARNRVRYSMNTALIAIGTRGGALEKAAIAVARRIGKVEVDHGETGCKTPDAVTYIPKAAAHRRQKLAKAGVKAKTARKKKAKSARSRLSS